MSDLQISLIIIGIIIIIGVAIFNWVQQLRYRRKIESALDQKHKDVLLEKTDDPGTKETTRDKFHERVEPQFDKSFYPQNTSKSESHEPAFRFDNFKKAKDKQEPADYHPSTKEPQPEESHSTTDECNPYSSYIVEIQSDSVISTHELNDLLHRKFDFHKPLSWFGQKEQNGPWEEIDAKTADHSGFIALKGCLLLADRAGPIREIDLSIFRDTVQEFAKQFNAKTECPEIVPSHEKAVKLDKFCADVDVMIGVNIISKDEGAFVGTKIRGLAEASGFKLESDGIFKYRNDDNHILFTLTNYESAPFIPENMKTITTHGITFLLDVPRVAHGERIFDQMTHLARIFSNTLGGIMVDDNRVPLSENGLTRSKQQLVNIQERMKKNNIIPGSYNALRLFN